MPALRAGRGAAGGGPSGSSAAQAAGVLDLVLRIEARQHVAGPLVDEMDEAEIQLGVADLDAVEMPIAVRHLEAAPVDDDGAVALPVRAMSAAGEGEA